MMVKQQRPGTAPQASYYEPSGCTGEQFPTLRLTVLFTSVLGTVNALRRAAHLAHQLGASIRILVPYIVPYPLPLDKPRVDPEFRLRQFHTLCERELIETTVDIRLCRDTNQCLSDALAAHSLIVIGGRRSWWPFSVERRVARHLTRAGHQVVLVSDRQPPAAHF